jgi:hypothetical protein
VWSVDSRPISYVAWSSQDGGTAENCMSLNVNDRTWSDNRCTNPMEFVCGKLIIIIIIMIITTTRTTPMTTTTPTTIRRV